MKLRQILIGLLLAAVFLAGCTAGVKTTYAEDYFAKVTDDLGREVIIKEKPQRIISLAPSHTETLFALEAGNRVVGVTEYADYPKVVNEIDKVGTIKEPNVEKIIQLQPDLVLAAGITPKEVITRLNELGIDVVGLNPTDVSEIIDSISLIDKATGQVEEAEIITTEMRNRVEEITETVAKNVDEAQRPKVFYEIWKKPLYTAGPETFIDDLIHLAGGINIAHQAEGMWPQYSFEVLLAENPEVYLASSHSWKHQVSKESILQREKFQEIKAIQNERVYIIDQDIVNRASPRIITALEKVAKAVHPELFN
ncbi:ABC transporter substrate-binding protein [Acetohalobium arabaticum]|uniref:Periplasmic binding protein n=1 Tax=Acetohalobium arabaticum (strain ATCC 49924 / DSM 5501 / Z-7288) TaxID=574087 RepID=D9QVP8_ACEAZ|nr:ABC transporter substrate-binding protein [Acetohalobium arabaticum]ADL12307.1 periplasmic binding protein [Acetohalobium arabaticum DSM 5501]